MFNTLSQELLLSVKIQKRHDTVRSQIESCSMDALQLSLKNDPEKKAFWINIYNAFFQILRKENKLTKPNIYRDRLILVAGKKFSLDDIEHGILRKFRYKYSLGYLKDPFVSSLIKTLAVDEVDYRIHFALNCGAESCPPIATYSANGIDSELNLATESFLSTETATDENTKTIWISALFKWFHGDFGGTKGIRAILKEKLKIETNGYRLKYSDYSWKEKLDNYVA
jgi:hypothetical protein